MRFQFTEEEKLFRKTVRDFVENEVIPKADEVEEREEFPRQWFERCAELGFFGVRYPEEVGGAGCGMVVYSLLCEELARGSMSLAASVAMQCMMGTDFIFRYGEKEHIEELLKPAIRGEKIGSFCLTEPDAGSDLGAITTTAKKDGDYYVLNGRKMWATHAPVADFFTILATQDRELGAKGVDFFLVERDTPGLIIGKEIKKLGTRALITGEIALEDCRIPKENLLGDADMTGFKNLLKILDQIRVMTGALGLGLAKAAFEAAAKYSHQRVAFKRPIGKFQAVSHKLADMAMNIYASELMVYDAARRIDEGEKIGKEAAMAKLFATETATSCADEAMRIYASYGYATEYPIHRYYRDCRFLLLGGGTSEILRNIIGGMVFKEFE